MPRPSNPAEEAVEKILEKLKDNRQILGFLRNRPSDRLDEEGIDFLIILKNKLALPLQVKTSSSNQGSFNHKLREHRRKHPLIAHLIFVPTHLLSSDPERAYKEVEKDLKKMMNL